jgi:hypothetical protein
MLIVKSQIETMPAFMGAVFRLPFDQTFLIRKQVQTVRLYIGAEFPQRHRSALPRFGSINRHTRESSPSRLRSFVSSAFVPASNQGMLFVCRAVILPAVVCLHSSVGIALNPQVTSHNAVTASGECKTGISEERQQLLRRPVREKRGKIVKWYGAISDIEDRNPVEQPQPDLAHVNRVNSAKSDEPIRSPR